MQALKKELLKLDIQKSAEQRLMYQIIDWQSIHYKGLQSGDIVEGDEISTSIQTVINGFIWLYEKGLSMEKSVEHLLSPEDKPFYENFKEAFAHASQFMTTHVYLHA